MSGRDGQKGAPKVGGSFMGGVDPALVTIAFIVAIGFSIVQWIMKQRGESKSKKSAKKVKKKFAVGEANQKLAGHTFEFNKKEILTVKDRIHVAIGFGLANCILIEGNLEFCAVLNLVKILFVTFDCLKLSLSAFFI